ncbi:hypothetical protein [Streptomyces sp. Wb2n-11]|uniref:hypothetical protein n=1 Tax=Streptomyces sp. Wb2n-11 TaxID=1030533 RepID=UPI000ACBE386|nr:hypothetical protein [Streptomyces sp. Wb2n-11]
MRIRTALAASAFAASVLLGSAGTALACDGENGPEGRHYSDEHNGRHHYDENDDKGRHHGDKGGHHAKGKEGGYAEYCNIGGENGVTHARFMGFKEHSKSKYNGHHNGHGNGNDNGHDGDYKHHGEYDTYCVSSHS